MGQMRGSSRDGWNLPRLPSLFDYGIKIKSSHSNSCWDISPKTTSRCNDEKSGNRCFGDNLGNVDAEIHFGAFVFGY